MNALLLLPGSYIVSVDMKIGLFGVLYTGLFMTVPHLKALLTPSSTLSQQCGSSNLQGFAPSYIERVDFPARLSFTMIFLSLQG